MLETFPRQKNLPSGELYLCMSQPNISAAVTWISLAMFNCSYVDPISVKKGLDTVVAEVLNFQLKVTGFDL